MSSLVVTTSRNPDAQARGQAQNWAQRLDCRDVPRRQRSLAALVADEQVSGVLVVAGKQQPVYYEPARSLEYFFHPNMAKVRIHNLKTDRGDPMITAMKLGRGDSVLDCTLGRGSDAIVASWVVEEPGKVVGVEQMPVLAELSAHGLATYEISPHDIAAAMRRIEVHHADYQDFLRESSHRSFDVVYFDPIFDQPIEASRAMAPLRAIANDRPVAIGALEQARRVATRAVVIKQRRGSDYWQTLPFEAEIVAGGSSRIEYGVITPGS